MDKASRCDSKDDGLLAEEVQSFVWARRRRGSARGGLKGVPEAVAGSGCWAAPDLGFGFPGSTGEDGSLRAVSLLKRAVS